MYIANFKLFAACLLSFSLLFFTSCEPEDTITPMNIVETAQENSELTSLVEALTDSRHTTDFATLLSGSTNYTTFAPNNAAFQALLDTDPSWTTLGDIPIATLDAVLKYHVIAGAVKSTDLTASYVNTLSTGPNSEAISLQIEVSPSVKFNGDAAPVEVDVEATNGVIHIIDKVMLPPTVVNHALNGADFTTLVAALTDSRHTTTDFVAVLGGTGPFTVFAPTNAAFQALLDSDPSWTTLGDIPIATLDAVLKYHVINGANVQSDELTDGQVVTTLEGSTLTVDLSAGAKLMTTSSQTVTIQATDVQGSNGVVHVINTVMLP
jgi:transforming growth factor-beta-induced protein